jgi:lysophospholipase L1-like esterase
VHRALRRAAPAIGVAPLLWWIGRAEAAAIAAVTAGLVVLLGLLAPASAEALDRLLARVARAIAAAVSFTLAGAAFVLAVLPVWVLGHLRTPPLLTGPQTGTAWSRSSTLQVRAPDGTPLEPGRAGSAHTATPDGGHPVLTLLAALVVTALLTVGLVAFGRSRSGEEGTAVDFSEPATKGPARARAEAAVAYDGLPVDEYAHEEEPFAPELFGEYLQLPYRSDFFLGHRIDDFDGRYVDIVDGRRVSYAPDDPELTVWFFGGSTMFGIGQRDDHTLPSVVARLAEADGIRIRAVNFGVSAYVGWQSLEQFEQALTSDELDPPDLAVFYGGLNERSLGAERVELGDVRPGTISRLAISDDERDEVRDALDNVASLDWDGESTELEIEMAAEQYRRGTELIGHLSESFDVPVVHVWQPSPFAKKPNPSDDELWQRLGYGPEFLPESTRQYDQVRLRSGVEVVDLTTSLDDVGRPVYFDGGHTNELGARIIGTQMYERLRPQLEELAGR